MAKTKRPGPPHPPSTGIRPAAPPSRIRILVADPHEITLLGTCTILEQNPRFTVAGKTTTIAGAVAAITRRVIDLALLELRFADGSGIDACRHIRSASPGTQVVILTHEINEETATLALQAGAAGILTKNVSGAGLGHAIEAVCDTRMIFDRGVFQQILANLCSLSVRTCGKTRTDLSHQEQQVMALVVEGKSNKEIAVVLGLSDSAVKKSLHHAYDKMQVTRRAQATKLFIEHTHALNTMGLADFGCPLLLPVPSN